MLAQTSPNVGRRMALGLAVGAVFAAAPWQPTLADAANTAPQAPIERLDSALLATMKAGAGTSFNQRYRTLEPVLQQVFNLDAVLAASIGLSWATMPNAQQAELAEVFRHYTVSSYVSNFNGYNGQRFEVLPTVRPVGNGEVIVQTQLIRTDDSPVKLDYVMRQGPAGWQVVDVLTDGSISRVAVQRSDFQALLASGGAPALAAGLERKAMTLSGGAV
jgi:phospholipid transport system substrate-binding protein